MDEDIFKTQVTICPVDLPDGPRGTMARLRGAGRFALLESALPMPRQAQWSYIAGPSLATLYTDEVATRRDADVTFGKQPAAGVIKHLAAGVDGHAANETLRVKIEALES